MNRIVNQLLKTALSELFVGSAKDTVQINIGSDLFSSSNVNLKNLTIRPDIFDACLHPLKLVSGHLGQLKIEGVAEAALGAPIKVFVENVFLLFTLSRCDDPEHVQTVKKILLELISNTVSYAIIDNMLRKILGMATDKSSDTNKQRKMIYMAMKHVFKILQVSVKKIHVRIEFDSCAVNGSESTTSASYSALGLTLPSLRVGQNLKLSHVRDGIGVDNALGMESDPSICLILKSLQVYCDYDCEPYAPPSEKGSTLRTTILRRFTEGWSSEVHTAVLLPFDLEVLCTVAVDVLSGHLSPKLAVAIPRLRFALDPRQVMVFKDLVEAFTAVFKRSENLYRLTGIFNDINPPPRVLHEKGIHILPQLLIGRQDLHFPKDISVPRDQSKGIAHLLQTRSAGDADMGGWARHMWRYAIDMVIRDLRRAMPLGKWKNLIRLCWARKEYAFLYGKYLRHVAMLNAKNKSPSPLSPADVIRLHEFEMIYPIGVIIQFREVAVTAFSAQEIFLKKKKRRESAKKRKSTGPSAQISAEKDFQQALSWRDVVHMITILKEEQRGIVSYVGHKSVMDREDKRDEKKMHTERTEDPATVEAVVEHDCLESVPMSPLIPNVDDTLDVSEKGNTHASVSANDNTAESEAPNAIDSPEVPVEPSTPGSVVTAEKDSQPPLSAGKKSRMSFLKRQSLSPSSSPSSSEGGKISSTASKFLSSMRHGLHHHSDEPPSATGDTGVSKAGKSGSTTPSSAKKTASLLTLSAPSSIKAATGKHRDSIDISEDGHEDNSRPPSVGDMSRFNSLLARSLRLTVDDDCSDTLSVDLSSGSEDDEEYSMGAPDYFDGETNNIIDDYSAMVDAARWVIRKHQSPVSVMLPNAQLHVDEIELSLRLPVENRSRRMVVSVEVMNTDAILSASSTTGESNNNMGTDSVDVVKKKVMAGLLIILKLSIDHLLVKVHGQKRRHEKGPHDLSPRRSSVSLSAQKSDVKDDASSNPIDIGMEASNSLEVTYSVLTSDKSDQFLSACILVDIPPGSGDVDKAVDVQASIAPLDISMKKDAFVVFIDPVVRANLSQCIYAMKRMKLHLAMLADKNLVLEYDADCLGVPSVLLRNVNSGNKRRRGTTFGNSNADDKLHIMEMHKKAVTDYLNSRRWYRVLSKLLPKGVISVLVRLSKINVDILSASSMRSFMIIWTQELKERAISDPTAAESLYLQNALNAYLKQASRQKRKSTKIGQRMSMSMLGAIKGLESGGGKSHVPAAAVIDPVVIELKKSTDPIPLISVNCPGLVFTLPMDDDTISRALSFVLGTLLPFYHIRAAPPPKSIYEVDEVEDEANEADADMEGERVDETIDGDVIDTIESANPAPVPEEERRARTLSTSTHSSEIFVTPENGRVSESKLPIASSPVHTWRKCDFSSFELRVSSSLFKKELRPSGRPLYTPIAVHTYRVPQQVDNIASHLPVPDDSSASDTSSLRGGCFIPPMLVVQLQMPDEPTSLMHTMQRKKDGPGRAVVMYFTLSKSVRKEMQDLLTASPSVKLFNEYCKHSYKEHAWQSRLKMITNLVNVDNKELPSLLASYDKKPVLMSKTGVVHKGPNYLEIDINIPSLTIIANHGPQVLFPHMHDMHMQLGFAVEGHGDSEFPETLCACLGLHKLVESRFQAMDV
mmetsp:Transcript_21463/g.31127  ORF Transcript_21463/g.31127 Transcript_21463/m.31127 type:complete len:1650 (-) Transcript_21463:216-5165(-)|eukprot:CAMPEP_0185035686 /NCGR_PEP_ID=MMETSP1103-20130426/27517_1 /TAXON_ID=36769 /ORGANISM="Paraphysomonas bandaiensis, Strain Caron Lab Isolate" /LENGTH=1649 /DNA_ID=CAMNT_0027572893 /DNA_START=45 /DNA_END=4994 /DNA_ORIENTATION=+